jgi:hypothetical protein
MDPATLIALLGLFLGSQGYLGLLLWKSNRKLVAAQTAQAQADTSHSQVDAAALLSSSVLALLTPLQEQLTASQHQLAVAVTYITAMRTDMIHHGVPVRPIPEELRNLAA